MANLGVAGVLYAPQIPVTGTNNVYYTMSVHQTNVGTAYTTYSSFFLTLAPGTDSTYYTPQKPPVGNKLGEGTIRSPRLVSSTGSVYYTLRRTALGIGLVGFDKALFLPSPGTDSLYYTFKPGAATFGKNLGSATYLVPTRHTTGTGGTYYYVALKTLGGGTYAATRFVGGSTATHTYTIVARDAAGNSSSAAQPLILTVVNSGYFTTKAVSSIWDGSKWVSAYQAYGWSGSRWAPIAEAQFYTGTAWVNA